MQLDMDLWQRGRQAFRWSILWVYTLVVALGLTLILAFTLFRTTDVSVTVGEPATADIVAPFTHTYTSNILTEQARQDAAKAVPDQYTSLDLNIGRTQLNLAMQTFNYIDTVRADNQANQARKIQYLQAIQTVNITNRSRRICFP